MAELSEGEREALIAAERLDIRLSAWGIDNGVDMTSFENQVCAMAERFIAARLAPIEALAEEMLNFEPCQGGDELHDLHLRYCLPFYEHQRSLRAALPAPRPVHPAGDEGRQG